MTLRPVRVRRRSFSSNYPSGQVNQGGAPIQVTSRRQWRSDVAGYVFSWSGSLPGSGHLLKSAPTEFRSPINPYTSDPANFAAAIHARRIRYGGLVPPTDPGSWS